MSRNISYRKIVREIPNEIILEELNRRSDEIEQMKKLYDSLMSDLLQISEGASSLMRKSAEVATEEKTKRKRSGRDRITLREAILLSTKVGQEYNAAEALNAAIKVGFKTKSKFADKGVAKIMMRMPDKFYKVRRGIFKRVA